MIRICSAAAVVLLVLNGPAPAQTVDSLAGKKVVFLGDSNTQAGGYVSFLSYFFQKQHPKKDFNFYALGLASETVSGLSEEGHAGGAFVRPCLFERLGRVLDKTKPEVVFACYGMNDGIYLPLDRDRFAKFKDGVTKLLKQCKDAGVKEVYLITPPIYDFTPKGKEFNYDTVLAEYAAWEAKLKSPGVRVIDLHSAMRKARDARKEPFSKDHVHPGDEGHLLMARTILTAFDGKVTDDDAAKVKADPLFKLVDEKRRLRSEAWMKHVGYTREKTVKPQPLGDAEARAAKLQEKIDAIRRK